MQPKIFFGILLALVMILSSFSMAEAHPHANVDLMESHSHNLHGEVFILHTFEHVIIDSFESIKNFLFS